MRSNRSMKICLVQFCQFWGSAFLKHPEGLSSWGLIAFETPRGSEFLGSLGFWETKRVGVFQAWGLCFRGLSLRDTYFVPPDSLHDKIIRVSNEQAMKTVTKCTGSHAAPRNRKKKPFRWDCENKTKQNKTKHNEEKNNNIRKRKKNKQKYRLKQRWTQNYIKKLQSSLNKEARLSLS